MTEETEKTAQIHRPGVLETPKKRRKIRISDIIVFAIIIIVVISLVVFIFGRLNLKHEVAQAKVVSGKVVAALAKQDTKTIRALGDKQFQAKNSAASLNTALTFHDQNSTAIKFADLYGDATPTVDRQIVANNSRGKHVAIIYRYNKLKVPFYVRVDVGQDPGSSTWTLQALSASSDETSLQT